MIIGSGGDCVDRRQGRERRKRRRIALGHTDTGLAGICRVPVYERLIQLHIISCHLAAREATLKLSPDADAGTFINSAGGGKKLLLAVDNTAANAIADDFRHRSS